MALDTREKLYRTGHLGCPHAMKLLQGNKPAELAWAFVSSCSFVSLNQFTLWQSKNGKVATFMNAVALYTEKSLSDCKCDDRAGVSA
ncbi:hypothetical protein BWQ96_07513 [Gracilariopsis chorda]|uniref:Uncharacterized protein n=1 Tax=Gracilariopsis chorda TaxID=448386 RepID=A0A2V3IL02_9FLOR|nr:hypothetical protein BWQ96_07513 [Gracilariopsis chorda]|eukprot:PXF42761.1 hypothetical protein BWQ96_07513 [Gracilariopsis chorda]